MPSTYSSNLRLELQATGENTSTWGVRANNDFELIEDAICGLVSVNMANANVTLSALNGAVDQSRNMFVNLTGANTAIRDVIIPSVPKVYFIGNGTTGGFDIRVKTAAGIAANVISGTWSIVTCSGTDCTNTYNIGASYLGGVTATFLQNSSNQNAGTLADARLPTTMAGKTFTSTITMNAANNGIEIGSNSSNTPFIDFHSAAGGPDYDSRIIASGGAGSGASGTGSLNLIGASVQANNWTIWTAGNDGSGSGLDADLLDGMHASDILAAAASFASGTRLVFQQTSAPTGWTKDTTHNNKAMRIVSGTVSSGGSVAFTTAFANQSVTGTTDGTTSTGSVGGTSLTEANLPSHNHGASGLTFSGNALPTHVHGPAIGIGYAMADAGAPTDWFSGSGASINGQSTTNTGAASAGTPSGSIGGSTANTGSGSAHSHSLSMNSHSHTFTGNAINLAVQYVDFIVCQKN